MKILIVDDSRAMRMIVKRTAKLAGIEAEFFEAENGLEALEQIAAQTPDLVLTDWNMPEMSGIELLEQLQADGNEVKIGMVTSECTQEMLDRAQAAGALFLIAKPFSPEKFKAAIDAVFATS